MFIKYIIYNIIKNKIYSFLFFYLMKMHLFIDSELVYINSLKRQEIVSTLLIFNHFLKNFKLNKLLINNFLITFNTYNRSILYYTKFDQLNRFINFSIDPNYYKDIEKYQGCFFTSCHIGLIHHMPYIIRSLIPNKSLGIFVANLKQLNFLYHQYEPNCGRKINKKSKLNYLPIEKKMIEKINSSNLKYFMALTDLKFGKHIKISSFQLIKTKNIPLYYCLYYYKNNQLQFDVIKISDPIDNYFSLEDKTRYYHDYYYSNYPKQILPLTNYN